MAKINMMEFALAQICFQNLGSLYNPNFEVKIFSAVNKNILFHFQWSLISLAVKRVGLAEHVSLVVKNKEVSGRVFSFLKQTTGGQGWVQWEAERILAEMLHFPFRVTKGALRQRAIQEEIGELLPRRIPSSFLCSAKYCAWKPRTL